ncbi:SCN10A [Symbiodinium sp. CCMP2592]|nr:SCN10A [Symbiodinium sp. CCMP2592]
MWFARNNNAYRDTWCPPAHSHSLPLGSKVVVELVICMHRMMDWWQNDFDLDEILRIRRHDLDGFRFSKTQVPVSWTEADFYVTRPLPPTIAAGPGVLVDGAGEAWRAGDVKEPEKEKDKKKKKDKKKSKKKGKKSSDLSGGSSSDPSSSSSDDECSVEDFADASALFGLNKKDMGRSFDAAVLLDLEPRHMAVVVSGVTTHTLPNDIFEMGGELDPCLKFFANILGPEEALLRDRAATAKKNRAKADESEAKFEVKRKKAAEMEPEGEADPGSPAAADSASESEGEGEPKDDDDDDDRDVWAGQFAPKRNKAESGMEDRLAKLPSKFKSTIDSFEAGLLEHIPQNLSQCPGYWICSELSVFAALA